MEWWWWERSARASRGKIVLGCRGRSQDVSYCAFLFLAESRGLDRAICTLRVCPSAEF